MQRRLGFEYPADRMTEPHPAASAPPEPAAHAGGQRRRTLAVLAAATAFGSAGLAAGGTAGGLLAVEITGTQAVAGLPIGALIIGQALSAILMAVLTHRSGRGRSLAIGYLLGIAGAAIVALAAVTGSLSVLLVGSLLLGGGNSAVFLARYAAAEIGGEAVRGKAIGAVLFAASIGAIASPNLLGPSSQLATVLNLPALTGLYLVAILCFSAAGLLLAVASLRPRSHGQAGAALLGQRTAQAVSSRQIVSGLGQGSAWTCLLLLAIVNLVMVAVMAIAPIHLDRHGTDLNTVGLVVAIHVAGMFLPSPLSGWLADRIGAWAVARAGALSITAAMVTGILLDMDDVLAMSAMLFLLGVGWNLGIVGGSALLVTSVPSSVRPSAEGIGEVAMGLAAGTGAALAGPVVHAGGFASLCAMGALMAATAAMLPFLASGYRQVKRRS